MREQDIQIQEAERIGTMLDTIIKPNMNYSVTYNSYLNSFIVSLYKFGPNDQLYKSQATLTNEHVFNASNDQLMKDITSLVMYHEQHM